MKESRVVGSFESIFTKAKQIHEENKIAYNIATKQQAEQVQQLVAQEEERRQSRTLTSDPAIDNCSDELYGYITTFGFAIDSYEQHELETDEYGHYLDRTLETYYCSFGVWQFKVHNYADVDIEEGIFSLTDITHKETGEIVDFYCDLGCRNTSGSRRAEVLEFLTYSSLPSYINEKYAKYVQLPALLREKGYAVEEKDYEFSLNQPNGYLELAPKLFVKVYRGWYDDFKVVVTNDKTWDVNSSNSDSCYKKAYFFDYESEADVDELVKCIEAFQEEQEGRIGYYENGHFYSNRDVEFFYKSLRDKDDYYKEAWNTYQIKVEQKERWDGRGYSEDESVIVNKYKGLELFNETELTFNDAAQWSKGEHINKSVITVAYDRQKSDQCHLRIKNYIGDDSDMEQYDEELDVHVMDESKCVGTVEMYGTFTELMKQLETYVHTMIAIHEVDI